MLFGRMIFQNHTISQEYLNSQSKAIHVPVYYYKTAAVAQWQGGGVKNHYRSPISHQRAYLHCATRSGNDNSAWVDIDGVHVPLLLPFQFRRQCPELFSVAVPLYWSALTRLLPRNGELSTHYWIESVRELYLYIFCIFPQALHPHLNLNLVFFQIQMRSANVYDPSSNDNLDVHLMLGV